MLDGRACVLVTKKALLECWCPDEFLRLNRCKTLPAAPIIACLAGTRSGAHTAYHHEDLLCTKPRRYRGRL